MYALVLALLLLAVPAAAQDRQWGQFFIQDTTPLNAMKGSLWSAPASGEVKRCSTDPPCIWVAVGGSSSGLPSGLITIATTSCPTGFTEVTTLNGKTLVGTLVANADVGTTGGADTITPAGTISQPTLTMDAITQVINHTHGFTDLRGSAAGSQTTTRAMTETTDTTSTVTTMVTANPAGGVASITPTGTVSQPTLTGTQFDNRSAFVKVIFCQAD